MNEDKILTEEEINRNKNKVISDISKISVEEITTYKQPKKQTFFERIKKIFGL